MDTEAQIKLAAEFEAEMARKDAHIEALINALGKLSFENRMLKAELGQERLMDVEAE